MPGRKMRYGATLGRRSLNNLPRAEAVMNKRWFITYKCGADLRL